MQHLPPQKPKDLARYIDHTLLRATASEAEIKKLCQEAVEHSFFAVCVNSCHVAFAAQLLKKYSEICIASVVGFPLGAMTTEAKVFEAQEALKHGAKEIDMVVRIDLVKTNELDRVREDIASVVQMARETRQDSLVKVILETGLLTPEEIVKTSKAAEAAGAQFIKTCTGFSTAGKPAGGATVEDIKLMRESVKSEIQIKASGGIRNFSQAYNLILAGANRLGTSSGVSLVTEGHTTNNIY